MFILAILGGCVVLAFVLVNLELILKLLAFVLCCLVFVACVTAATCGVGLYNHTHSKAQPAWTEADAMAHPERYDAETQAIVKAIKAKEGHK